MSRVKEFNLPDVGEGLTEAELLTWHVKVGDRITLNQVILEIETAKSVVEIPAKWAGVVTKIYYDAGTTVDVGAPIIAIDTDPDAGDLPADPAPTAGPSAEALAAVEVAPSEGAVEPGLIGGPAPGGRTAVLVGYGPKTAVAKRRARKDDGGTASAAVTTSPAAPTAPAPVAAAPVATEPAATEPATINGGGVALAKPPVRKLARDLGVDLQVLTGSGPQGSITRDDVHAALSAPAESDTPVTTGASTAASFGPDREQRIAIKGVRKLTAENMVTSAFTAPHVTMFLTVDVTRTMKALDRLRALPEWRDVRVSPLLMVAKAAMAAIERHPMINSTWSAATNEIIVKEYVNLGIAAATDRGLIVPNIKDAGRLSMRELADAMTGLVQTAKSGKTQPADMSGGTFTITNVGVFGVDTGTPILPPGEAAILVFGTIRDTPWVHHKSRPMPSGRKSKGKIKVRQVTTLGLSFDHRIVDGELGSKFMRDLGAFLTDPQAALLAWG